MTSFLLTFDIEDWFQVENLRPLFPPSSWNRQCWRVDRSTATLLDVLGEGEHALGRPVKATFFVLYGQEKPFVMGCYGIGVSRVLAATIEQNHDENGIIFPWPIAPFHLALIPLEKDLVSQAENLYSRLKAFWEILLDDREERPGVKFKDIDLIGIPIQIILGKGYKEKGEVEIKIRKNGERLSVKPEDLVTTIKNLEKTLNHESL